ncbi:MAG: hypothetical protein LBS76_00405 [Mycoplasmataceae bacterium]|jgi:hypothetical protein|nr:hypothetical protein [Mycoplasmataceae bacterium]
MSDFIIDVKKEKINKKKLLSDMLANDKVSSDKIVSFRIDTKLIEKVKDFASRNNTTISKVIVTIIDYFFSKE